MFVDCQVLDCFFDDDTNVSVTMKQLTSVYIRWQAVADDGRYFPGSDDCGHRGALGGIDTAVAMVTGATTTPVKT